MEVIVIGGGIAGLTMALSLDQAGIAVRVYEAVRDLVPLGVGINLQPIAVRELTELGIEDAAHPMQPIGSQAGSQAIVDARVLTATLLASSDPIAALQRYDTERRPVMDDVTLRNRDFGPEAGMQL